MADVLADLKNWSATASSNLPAGTTAIGTGLDDNLRQLQATVRQDLAAVGANIASAGTCDLGAIAGLFHTITGTTSITSFGTVAAGIWKVLTFSGALTITHNGTSLICPYGANITTTAGDTLLAESLGSGNWKIHPFHITTLYAALAGSASQPFSASNFTTAQGVQYPATQNPSADANNLDDYEEGTFTGTLTGCTTSPTYEFKYTKIGNKVTLHINNASGRAEGTSNATTKTITGMPSALYPSVDRYFSYFVSDNGGAITSGFAYIASATGILHFFKDIGGNAWTSSGSIVIYPLLITYCI